MRINIPRVWPCQRLGNCGPHSLISLSPRPSDDLASLRADVHLFGLRIACCSRLCSSRPPSPCRHRPIFRLAAASSSPPASASFVISFDLSRAFLPAREHGLLCRLIQELFGLTLLGDSDLATYSMAACLCVSMITPVCTICLSFPRHRERSEVCAKHSAAAVDVFSHVELVRALRVTSHPLAAGQGLRSHPLSLIVSGIAVLPALPPC